MKYTVRLLADDCLLCRPINIIKDHHTLQHDLQKLEIWAKKWGMRFNAMECYTMSIDNKSSQFYELDKHILQQVPENPYLGITISEDLKWTSHINKSHGRPPWGERFRALFLNHSIISPLCLVWVRAPFWPHVRQAKFCLRACQVFLSRNPPVFAHLLIGPSHMS